MPVSLKVKSLFFLGLTKQTKWVYLDGLKNELTRGTMALDCGRVPIDSNKLDKPICRFPVETLVGVPAISLVTIAPRTCLQVNRSIWCIYGIHCKM